MTNEDDITPIEKGRKQETSSVTGATPEAKKMFWDAVFLKLTESQRFLDFIDRNYVIGVHRDEEAKTVEIQVVEKPTIQGPPLSGDQQFKMHVACTRAGAKEPLVLLRQIMRILGQEPPAVIATADESEMRRAIADLDNQEKLKKGLDDQ